MNKLSKYLSVGALAVAVLYGAGVWVSGHYAEEIIDKALAQLNANLDKRHQSGSLMFDIKTSYEQLEKGFFSQKGNIVLKTSTSDKEYRIPVDVCHGFLRLQSKADFFHFLNNLFLKNGVLERDSAKAIAKADVRLFPLNYSLKVEGHGSYSKNYLAFDKKRAKDANNDTSASFTLHRSTFGTVSVNANASNIVTPNGLIGGVFIRDVYEEHEDSLGNIYAALSDMNLHGTAFDELYALRAKVQCLKGSTADGFGINLKLMADTTKGHGSADLSAGDFSKSAIEKSGGSIAEAATSPLSLLQYLVPGSGYLKLNDLDFKVNFTSPLGHVKYDIAGNGGIKYPSTDLSLSEVNGKFTFKFEHVNDKGESVIDALGRSLFVKDGKGYRTDISIRNGHLSFNEK